MNGRNDFGKLFEDFTKIFLDNIESECVDLNESNDVINKQNKTIQTASMAIYVTVDNLDSDLKPDTNESYSLNITSGALTIKELSKSVFLLLFYF